MTEIISVTREERKKDRGRDTSLSSRRKFRHEREREGERSESRDGKTSVVRQREREKNVGEREKG